MQKIIFSILSVLFLCLQTGCSIQPLGYGAANTKSLAGRTDVQLIDPNNGPYLIKITRTNDGTLNYWWEIDSQIEQKEICRVKYHDLYSTGRFMVVQGKIGDGAKRYPIVLDTGASQAIFVKDTHVLDNKLSIYPMETSPLLSCESKNGGNSKGYGLGLCYLPKLWIGDATLVNMPCFYIDRHMKLELFGMPIAEDDSIIVGLPALREFKYIVFDSVKKEVELSHTEVFKPDRPELWERYPLSIEEDFHGNTFLLVEIPVGGEKIELQLDTGSGRGLAVAEELWEEIREKIEVVKLTKGKELYPYIGRLSCKQGVIGELKIGNRTVRNAQISVFPNDSPLVSDYQGLLGMQYFQDTVIVLDFEEQLLWIKNPVL